MSVEFKNNWVGKFPCAIILTGKDIDRVLYYETGFEQLHPFPQIHNWMKERGFEYYENWKVIRLGGETYRFGSLTTDWVILFEDEQIAEMFMLKWL